MRPLLECAKYHPQNGASSEKAVLRVARNLNEGGGGCRGDRKRVFKGECPAFSCLSYPGHVIVFEIEIDESFWAYRLSVDR